MHQADQPHVHTVRRNELRMRIKEQYPTSKQGAILLCAGFEQERVPFRQESSFYYLTGITEPGVVMLVDLAGKTTLLVPHCQTNRSKWMKSQIDQIEQSPKAWGIDEIISLGEALCGFQMHPFSETKHYHDLIARLAQLYNSKYTLFTLAPNNPHEYVEQRMLLQRLFFWVQGLDRHVQDVSPIVADMRRYKDMSEIEALYKVIEITILAQEAAANAIEPGINEAEVQATAEYMMIGSHARPAFASIIGGGINSTILHYHANSEILNKGDLVVVDIGAESDYYCADITRTYPVSGIFNARQKELYNIVLATQEYVADMAHPGMWLSNKDKPQESLHHLAVEFLERKGYGQYFTHGIGHFLGLDVHDVGDRNEPLDEGDVFTIEPGIYIPAEKTGIRIEDDYWMTKDGVVCLSDDLPRSVVEIEQLMQSQEEKDSAASRTFSDETEYAQG